jgi:hypothetical protein
MKTSANITLKSLVTAVLLISPLSGVAHSPFSVAPEACDGMPIDDKLVVCLEKHCDDFPESDIVLACYAHTRDVKLYLTAGELKSDITEKAGALKDTLSDMFSN